MEPAGYMIEFFDAETGKWDAWSQAIPAKEAALKALTIKREIYGAMQQFRLVQLFKMPLEEK